MLNTEKLLHATIFYGFVEKKNLVEIGKTSLARVMCVQNLSFKEKLLSVLKYIQLFVEKKFAQVAVCKLWRFSIYEKDMGLHVG